MKHRTGNLYLRGNMYWLKYMIEGRLIRQSLDTSDQEKAQEKQKEIMRPLMATGRVDALAIVQSKLADAKTKAVIAHDESNPPLRIADAWEAYLNDKINRPESGELTLKQYQYHWDRFAKWLERVHPETEFLRDVSSIIATEYANNLARAGLSPNRFNKHITFLKLLFRVLAKLARIAADPFAEIHGKKLRTHSRRELTIPELSIILDQADGDLALLLLIGASTGLRLGDCATLTWGEVDLTSGIIRRIPNKTKRNNKPVVLGIVPTLHTRLMAIPQKARTGYVLPDMAEKYKRDPTLITNAVKAHVLECGINVHAPGTGEQIKRKSDGTPERDEKSGEIVTEDTKKPAVVDVGFHSLRHTWVSMHAARGTPQAVIQDSVGHSNPAMTAHYTHVSEATARDVALALPAFTATGTPALALPASPADILEQVRALGETLSGKNWKTVRAEILKIVPAKASSDAKA